MSKILTLDRIIKLISIDIQIASETQMAVS